MKTVAPLPFHKIESLNTIEKFLMYEALDKVGATDVERMTHLLDKDIT